jgi:hypothetical protein
MLCEVLQREWAVLYYWSEDLGSHMTLIHRDRAYCALLWQVRCSGCLCLCRQRVSSVRAVHSKYAGAAAEASVVQVSLHGTSL